MKNPGFFFKRHSNLDLVKANNRGSELRRIRVFTNPKSGGTAMRLRVFPTSPDEANNPQVVKRPAR